MSSIAQLTLGIKAQFGRVLNGRIEAGHALAIAGAVTKVNPNTWRVASQSEPERAYTVKFSLAWSCTCPDHLGTGYHPAPTVEFFGGVQPTCKHVISAAVCWASGEYPADPIIARLQAIHEAGGL